MSSGRLPIDLLTPVIIPALPCIIIHICITRESRSNLFMHVINFVKTLIVHFLLDLNLS